MELRKVKHLNPDKGYDIIVKIGDKEYRSWWTSPPEENYIFDMEYLRNRYSCITTRKRAEEFSRLWPKLWEKKYLILCNRHPSIFGDNWCLWWGCRESKSSYSTDVRLAHRFTYDEAIEINDKDDIMISIDALGISEGYESEETYNKNLRVLIEKGTLNEMLNMSLKPNCD